MVVAEPAGIAAAEARGPARLYVVLTRAVTSLTVPHRDELPAEPNGRGAHRPPPDGYRAHASGE